ncbi:hypothetical protein EOM09_06575 [bacterium]|nr:hypothetical protein [bacterium]
MKIINLPQLRQTYNFDCGAKALQSILFYYGIDVREDKIMKIAKTNKNGTSIQGIGKVIKKYGLKMKASKMNIDILKNYINDKTPVLIALQAWSNKKRIDWSNNWSDGHWVVVIGYTKEKIIFEDPSSIYKTYLKYNELLERWHDIDTNGKKYLNLGIAVYGDKPSFKIDKLVHMN